jgi:hypothetical protein
MAKGKTYTEAEARAEPEVQRVARFAAEHAGQRYFFSDLMKDAGVVVPGDAKTLEVLVPSSGRRQNMFNALTACGWLELVNSKKWQASDVVRPAAPPAPWSCGTAKHAALPARRASRGRRSSRRGGAQRTAPALP